MKTFMIETRQRVDLIDITNEVQRIVGESGISGTVTIFVPHTTCGITINEHCDPDVIRDIRFQLENLVPRDRGYRHAEGNSDSHIKTSLIGSSETIIIENGKLVLGTWQGVFLCDFDGPRTRKIHLQIVPAG